MVINNEIFTKINIIRKKFQSSDVRTGLRKYCSYHDNVLQKLSNRREETWGVADCEFSNIQGYAPLLTDAPDIVRRTMEESQGINVPMLFVNTAFTVDFMHHEDQILDSVHLFRAGSEDSERLVLAILRSEMKIFQKCIVEQIKVIKNKSRRKTDELGGKNCPLPLQHKNMCVSTKWLDDNKIGYCLIRLFPGDLLYVGPEIFYQQIDIGFIIVESVNVGSPNWNDKAQSFTECECGSARNLSLNNIFDINLDQQIISSVRPKYECSVDGCLFFCHDMPAMSYHYQSHIIRPGKKGIIVCDVCNKIFANRNSLRQHKEYMHGSRKPDQTCVCGKTTRYRCFARHKNICEIWKADFLKRNPEEKGSKG